ncbi:MAG TPA: zf-HC2 domain-containing protein [Gaiellaceae bacterium]
MVGFQLRRTTCEKAIRSISLRLDGELSELEETALDSHLAECPRCSAIAAETVGFTQLLRGAPLVEPGRQLEVVWPRRAHAERLRRRASAIALAGCVVFASVVAVLSGAGLTGPTHPSSALGFRDLAEQQQFARSEVARLEPYAQFVVETASPRLVGRGLV